MIRRCILSLMLLVVFVHGSSAQDVALQLDTTKSSERQYLRKRSVESIKQQKRATDSIITSTWVLPDSLLNKSILLDSVEKEYMFPTLNLWAWQQKYKKAESPYRLGNPRPKGSVVFLGVLFLTLVLFAILKFSYAQQFSAIVGGIFTKRGLSNINKEESFLNSWPYLFLFLLFGLIFGSFLFLVVTHYSLFQAKNTLAFILGASVLVVVLLGIKLIILRFLGFLFNVQKPVNNYISMLYVSYFNVAILFVPLVVAFALAPLTLGVFFIVLGCIVFAAVFLLHFVRFAASTLSVNKFSKVHLFLYFCALEICPILILIKAIGL